LLENILFNIGIILILTSLLGILCKFTKQSLILAYIGTGILIGPVGQQTLNLIGINIPFISNESNQLVLESLSVFGILLLLFLVGLDFNLKSLRGIKGSIFLICFGQIALTFVLAFWGLSLFFNNYLLVAILSISLVFSSTIVAVKMLVDKKDLNSLYGKITIGILLSQDLLALFTLIIISNLTNGNELSATTISFIIFKFFGLLLFTYAFSKYVLRHIFHYVARMQELLFLTAIANCFLFAIIAHSLHISIEIGAFLGGISIAVLPYRKHIEGKIKPLRDFFLILFFVTLGLQFEIGSLFKFLPLALFLIGFTLLIKPLVIFITILLAGFKKRTAFLTSIHLSQLSEFSLILLGTAVTAKLIPKDIFSIITLVTIISIIVSNHLGFYAHRLFFRFHKYLKIKERKNVKDSLHNIEKKLENHIILCGYEGMGEDIFKSIKKTKKPYLIVDFNPQVIQKLMKKNIPCIFGDITDPDILDTINIKEAYLMVSTITLFDDNAFMLNYLGNKNKNVITIVEGQDADRALELYNLGADYVIITEFLGGNHASLVLEEMHKKDFKELIPFKETHIKFLHKKHQSHT